MVCENPHTLPVSTNGKVADSATALALKFREHTQRTSPCERLKVTTMGTYGDTGTGIKVNKDISNTYLIRSYFSSNQALFLFKIYIYRIYEGDKIRIGLPDTPSTDSSEPVPIFCRIARVSQPSDVV